MVFKYTDIKNKTSEELTKTLAEHIENNGGNVSIDFLADEIKRKETGEMLVTGLTGHAVTDETLKPMKFKNVFPEFHATVTKSME